MEEKKPLHIKNMCDYNCDNCPDYFRCKDFKIQVLRQENLKLKEEIKELEFIVGLRQRRDLIRKFDKEYDFEDKEKNPNRDYVSITPDAEEVYKRYYELKDRIDKAVKFIEKNSIYDSFNMLDGDCKILIEILKK